MDGNIKMPDLDVPSDIGVDIVGGGSSDSDNKDDDPNQETDEDFSAQSWFSWYTAHHNNLELQILSGLMALVTLDDLGSTITYRVWENNIASRC